MPKQKRLTGANHPNPDVAVAWHEAGHALACLALGLAFEFVTVTPDEKTLGRVHGITGLPPEQASGRGTRSHWRKRMVVSYAGAAAEGLFVRQACLGDGEDEVTDLGQIWDVAMRLEEDPDRMIGLMAASERRAMRVVERQRRAIGGVARVLLERKMLTFDEVRAIVEEVNLRAM